MSANYKKSIKNNEKESLSILKCNNDVTFVKNFDSFSLHNSGLFEGRYEMKAAVAAERTVATSAIGRCLVLSVRVKKLS